MSAVALLVYVNAAEARIDQGQPTGESFEQLRDDVAREYAQGLHNHMKVVLAETTRRERDARDRARKLDRDPALANAAAYHRTVASEMRKLRECLEAAYPAPQAQPVDSDSTLQGTRKAVNM